MLENLSKELNKIALLEFKANYDKSEIARIFNEGEHTKLAKELEERLNKEIKQGYKAIVSSEGLLMINKDLGNGIWRQEKSIIAPISSRLPYIYVMGKKVSKKVAEDILYRFKYILEED